MYRLMVKSLLSNEMKMKGNEAVKANSDMFKDNEKNKYICSVITARFRADF